MAMDAAQVRPNPKILDSKDKIKVYCGNISDHVFDSYIRAGMPALYMKGRGWLAYSDNIDEWFRRETNVPMKDKLDQITADERQNRLL
jgi:hypothetical protein